MVGRNACRFVILWRSKERSDAAQTIESIPLPISVAAVQNSAPQHPTIKVTEWILGSALRFASLRPWMTTSCRPRPIVKR
ncbi:MAG: hypothetical protein E5X74_25205 [Mesorhizobium sp.]|nr:MAG: hypothetical protein EOR74_22205 [Mesorhizobium sp.]TIO74496.1 MAG: hypothetical protein E5X75_23520 [Mesorhizobium sp.]TIO82358.1 MAG: hypothetical protein E5X74_25205 [Mesorhizobium sp.]